MPAGLFSARSRSRNPWLLILLQATPSSASQALAPGRNDHPSKGSAVYVDPLNLYPSMRNPASQTARLINTPKRINGIFLAKFFISFLGFPFPNYATGNMVNLVIITSLFRSGHWFRRLASYGGFNRRPQTACKIIGHSPGDKAVSFPTHVIKVNEDRLVNIAKNRTDVMKSADLIQSGGTFP